jgi:hypothetical protein
MPREATVEEICRMFKVPTHMVWPSVRAQRAGTLYGKRR